MASKRQRVAGTGENELKPFWDVYAGAGEDIATGIDEELERFPEDVAAMFYEGEFYGLNHIAREIERYKGVVASTIKVTDETIR